MPKPLLLPSTGFGAGLLRHRLVRPLPLLTLFAALLTLLAQFLNALFGFQLLLFAHVGNALAGVVGRRGANHRDRGNGEDNHKNRSHVAGEEAGQFDLACQFLNRGVLARGGNQFLTFQLGLVQQGKEHRQRHDDERPEPRSTA